MTATTYVPWLTGPYTAALRSGGGPLFLRRADGWLLPLEVERWCADADSDDRTALRRCEGAVLDIGCGPGRLVAALRAQGRAALGIDVNPEAVRRTVDAGGRALRRSLFDPLPHEGTWGSALLLDGNLGIGGDPLALLDRTADVLAPGGLLLAETAPVDVDERALVRVVGRTDADAPTGDGPGVDGVHEFGEPFLWTRLGTAALLRYALPHGWRAEDQWSSGGRSFVALRRRSS